VGSDRREHVDPTDAEWLRALKRREAWAWERLHQVALDRVFGYIQLRTPRREDAEDLTAEVFAAAVVSIQQFRGDASIVTWLIGIARRKIIDAARRRQRRPELLAVDLPVAALDGAAPAFFAEDAAAQDPEAWLERRHTIARVRALVLQLPEAQREALWLRCVDEFSLAEIAHLLGRSENAVKGLLHRARSTVLERLTHEDAPPQPRPRPQEPHDAGPLLASALPAAPPAAD
jgi:RNA polymerase sigma-70 factor (ECF subfamily)